MDPKQFDALVQALTTAGTRRRALRLVTGTLAALGASRVDGALAATSKKHGHAHAAGHDPAHDSAALSAPKKKHHQHHHHPPPPATGGCTTDGSSLSQTSQTTFKGQTLQATQTVQPHDPSAGSQLDVTLGGAAVLSIAIAINGQTVTTTITYGAAFQGVQRAKFANDGTTITGDVDGRAIKPLPADADLSQAQFVDGGPPPDLHIDNDLSNAVQSLLQQAGQAASQCSPPPPAGAATRKTQASRHRKAAQRHVHASVPPEETSHPEESVGCLLGEEGCGAAEMHCIYLAAVASAACGPFAPLCAGGEALLCAATAEGCRRLVYQSPSCCPVKCGGDSASALFFPDPSCCDRGQSCLDPNDNNGFCCPADTYSCQGKTCCNNGETCSGDGLCCPNGKHACAGICCSDGACQGDFCCEGEHGSPCGTECCGAFANCCNGHCCTGTCCNGSCCEGVCTNGVCCTGNSFPCGNGCCDTVCCNDACCPAGAACQNGACVQICTATQFSCDCNGGCTPRCCDSSQFTDCCSWGCGTGACTR